jgi:hypothetical protein
MTTSASASVPVSVTPEAAARIARLGLQDAVDRMIAHARQAYQDVVRIEVVLYDRYEAGDEPGLAIEVYSNRPHDPRDRTHSKVIEWAVREFPPEVLWHLIIDHIRVPRAG